MHARVINRIIAEDLGSLSFLRLVTPSRADLIPVVTCPSCRISTAIKRTPSVRVEHSYDNESNSAKCEMAKEETARIADREQRSSAPG